MLGRCECGLLSDLVVVDMFMYYRGERYHIEGIEALECMDGHVIIPEKEKNRIKEELQARYERKTFILVD